MRILRVWFTVQCPTDGAANACLDCPVLVIPLTLLQKSHELLCHWPLPLNCIEVVGPRNNSPLFRTGRDQDVSFIADES